MIHIVFNDSEVALLHEVIGLDETLAGEVIQIKDDYAVGPLQDLYDESGITARKQWWRDVLAGGDYELKENDPGVDDNRTVKDIIEKLQANESEVVWIWAAQNSHDVSGYYWLLLHLKQYAGRIFILYLNNLPFISEKGNIFYPEWLQEIPAKEFLKAKKLAREITPGEFEVDPDEWQKIAGENRGVRRLEGGKKLIQHNYDHFDAELKKFVTKDFQKVSGILHQYYSKSKLTTGDAYLLWRLKDMAAQDIFDVQGEMKGMKDFELRTKQD